MTAASTRARCGSDEDYQPSVLPTDSAEDPCRVVARVADKFGHVRVDHVTYSVPIRHAYRPVWVKLYHDRVAIAVGAEVVAEHRRAFCRGAKVLDAFHGSSAESVGRTEGW